PWQLDPVFLVMAVGWGSMSGAAINIILAPWFERRRGLAVSVAFNGATLGGVTVAPVLIPLIAVLGFTRALVIAGLVSFGAVIAVAAAVMRRGPEALGLGPDGEAAPSAVAAPGVAAARRWRGDALRTWRFWSVCALFGLGVGNLTTLPGLILAVEWPRERFSALVGLAVAINQFTFAFGPSLVGVIRDRVGGDALALAACATLQALAAVMILLGPGRPPPSRS